MGKISTLVVLCDDTWCGSKTRPGTNMYILARLIGIDVGCGKDSLEKDGCQARYFDGPGLGNNFLDRLFSGSMSNDIATRCVDVYRYIVNNFTEKHEIWMFGLGGGAYVVRCVAGMINNCGIIKRTGDDDETALLIDRVYSAYASKDDECEPSSPQMAGFRRESSWAVRKPVKFMGILDTTTPGRSTSLLSLVTSELPPMFYANVSSVIQNIYHAVSLHERLPFVDLCPIRGNTVKREIHDDLPHVHEKWFPGMHYDLGRQSFAVTLHIGAILGLPDRLFPLPGLTIQPNAVLSDLVLMWILETIREKDSSGKLIPDLNRQIVEVSRRITLGCPSKGHGDIYSHILEYFLESVIPSVAPFLSRFHPGIARIWPYGPIIKLRERKIIHANASTYEYKRQFDQSGATIEKLAKISKERYPSNTYEEFQLYRLHAGEIDQATYECLLGKEHLGLHKTSAKSIDTIALNISWNGPDFFIFWQGDLRNVITIVKARAGGEYYVARTIGDFMAEVYGSMGISLLKWLTELCILRTRVTSRGTTQVVDTDLTPELIERESIDGVDEPYPAPLKGLDEIVHLHVEPDSLTAYFGDKSLRLSLPETSGDQKARVLSALSWVMGVLQIPNGGAEGLFRVDCNDDESGIWSTHYEEFKPGKDNSSCWTQLFNFGCVAETPRDFSFDVGERPEGLEIDFGLLVTLARVSRALFTDYGVVFFGFDVALIQLPPVQTRKWHVVRTPGKLITPVDILEAIKSSLQLSPGTDELEKLQKDISAQNLGTEERKGELENDPYLAGNVYVGWCDEPRACIGITRPSREFLNDFDNQSGVSAVDSNMMQLANVTTTTTVNVGISLKVLGAGLGVNLAQALGQQFVPATTAVKQQVFRLFAIWLHNVARTPCILWDDSVKRAWLLPGAAVLLFASLCHFENLGLTFDRPITYAEDNSDDLFTSASRCLEINQPLRLTRDGQPIEITFGDLVTDLWSSMTEASTILCYSSQTHRKHVKEGIVFGYDLYDLLGTGHVVLRYLDKSRAGPNLRCWEPLARLDGLQVIFCNRVGQVIKCRSENCMGAPCQLPCQNFESTKGVLSCLLQDFKRFFAQDWEDYPQRGILAVKNGMGWIPSGWSMIQHSSRDSSSNGVCACCAQLDRLQSVRCLGLSKFERFRRHIGWSLSSSLFTDTRWLNEHVAVRFGSVSHLRIV